MVSISPKGPLTQGLGNKGGERRNGHSKSGLLYFVLLLYGAWEHLCKRKLPMSYWIPEQRQLRNYETRGHRHLADGESEAQATQAMRVEVLTHLLEGGLVQASKE